MTTQAEAFVLSYLGETANLAPSPAAADRMHDLLLADGIPNVKNAGQMGSPMAVPGTWPWAYCLHHKVIAPAEAQPHFLKYVNENLEWRGLGSGNPPSAVKPATVYDAQHFTVTQHWLIGALSPDSYTRKLAQKQALDLRKLILADKVCEPSLDEINPRANGWSLQGLHIDNMGTAEASEGIAPIVSRLQTIHSTNNGVPFYTINTPSLTDPRHGYLPCCPWMQLTNLRGFAWRYKRNPSNMLKGLVLHGLKIMEHAMTEDGRIVDDYGWDVNGNPAFYDDGKETMDSWCDPAMFAAKDALGDEWPVWAHNMMLKRHDRYMALNRWKATDSGFRDQKNMSLAIDYAVEWGWRA